MSIVNSASAYVVNAAQQFNDLTKQAKNAVNTNNSRNGLESVNQAADWIKNAADSAMAIIDKARAPIQKIPPILLLCRLKYLPGLSATALSAMIIEELANKGFVTEVNFDGTPNDIVQFVQCLVGPIVQHIKDCAAVQGIVETPTGPLPLTGKVD